MSAITYSNTNLEYFDGFDDYSTAQIPRYWSTNVHSGNPYFTSAINANITIDSANGRNGSSCLKFSASGSTGALLLTLASQPTRTIGFALKLTSFFDSNSNGPYIIIFHDTVTPQVGVVINGDGTISVYRLGTNGSVGTLLLGPSTQSLSLNTYAYLEFQSTIHPTAGTAFVRVNGATWLTSTPTLNTRNTANSSANGVSVGMPNSNGTAQIIYIEDFYVRSDSTFMGDQRVETRLPNANGATNVWVPSTAPNFSCVNENPANDDTNYVFSANVGDTDLYIYPSMATTAGVVAAVMACPVERVDTAGAATSCAVYRSTGGTVYNGGTQNIGATTYNAYMDIQGQDPSTSAPWTVAGVNAFQYGVKRLS